MTPADLRELQKKFARYGEWFTAEAADPGPYILKRDHTRRVSEEIVGLGREKKLAEADLLLAEAAALLHDIGRFRQYWEYGTFIDLHSVDHARLGLQVIREERLLENYPGEEQNLLEAAVACHNQARLPPDRTGRELLLIQLLRDADKLDIWRVCVQSYQHPDGGVHPSVRLGLPDTDHVSPKVLQAVFRRHPVNSGDIRCLNDLKLLQASWVFDLNFSESRDRVRERGIIPAIFATLPAVDTLQTILQDIQEYLQQK